MLDILQTLWLIVLLYVGSWSYPLGGLLWMFVGLLTQLPYIGRVIDWLVNKPIYLGAIIKPITWLVASSGILLGLIVFELLGNQLRLPIQYVIVALFAARSVLKMLYDLITFNNEAAYIDEIFPLIAPFLERMRGDGTTDLIISNDTLLTRLARSLFVDQTLPSFFRLLISIGILYFALGHLGLLQTVNGQPPELGQSVLLAFSVLDLTGSIDIPFTGTAWELLRVANALLAFFWLVLFVSLASSTVDNAAERLKAQYLAELRKRSSAT
jgi:hypothetical protein